MKKLAILCLGLLTASEVAQAAGLPEPMLDLIQSYASTARSAALPKASKNCADFSGNWEGQCVSLQGRNISLSLGMKQNGCESVEVNKDTVSFGSNALIAVTLPKNGFVAANWSARFSDEGKKLIGQLGFSVNEDDLAAPLGGRVSFIAQQNDAGIHVHGLVNVWVALQDLAKEEFDCDLHKQ